jgi:SAM-dependent methyltransferase
MFWFLLIVALVLLFSFAYAAVSGAPWVPTWKQDIDRLEKLLALRPTDTFIELGCGDGRVTCEMAKRTGATCIGVELSLVQFVAAQLRRILNGLRETYIVFGNIFSANISNASVVYMFLMPETYEKIRPKLEAEMKKGSRVVAYVWPIPGWEPAKIDTQEGRPNLYLYVR